MSGQLIDPVTSFQIPRSWLELSEDPEALEKVRSGRWVILSDGRLLRRGYTTGTTAAAACKGAVISLRHHLDRVEVMTPAGIRVALPVKANCGLCKAVKECGDHQLDVTDGVEIVARAVASAGVRLAAGRGVGRVVGKGLCTPLGRPAISRSARQQILAAIQEGLEAAGLDGATVEICIPLGEELGERTLNPKMGVRGGISILGSTGFVEPWNEHLVESRVGEIKGLKRVVVTTGRTGLRYSRILFPQHEAVLIGSKLDRLQFHEGQESILCGLPALILRWAWPEILDGTGYTTVVEMVAREPDHPHISLALERARRRLPFTRIVLLHGDGRILRDLG
jgi:cobalt-precorrin-5B (C1)-methyltransferase